MPSSLTDELIVKRLQQNFMEITGTRFKSLVDQMIFPLGPISNQIDDGIEKAHNFLFIIAPHSINSPYVQERIELAIKLINALFRCACGESARYLAAEKPSWHA
jgi:hypothetical protein